jgi:hypothetical protein
MRLGGPQSRSGRGGEEKNSQPRRQSNPRTPIVQPVVQRYTDWAITQNIVNIKLSSIDIITVKTAVCYKYTSYNILVFK